MLFTTPLTNDRIRPLGVRGTHPVIAEYQLLSYNPPPKRIPE